MIGLNSCKKDVFGCTDPSATNYNATATDNDGSCQYNGQVVFWINSPMSYVDVTMNGIDKTITIYYPSGGVECSSSGCAIYTVPTGTYSYYAEEQDALFDYWSGNVTVTKNGCLSVLLN